MKSASKIILAVVFISSQIDMVFASQGPNLSDLESEISVLNRFQSVGQELQLLSRIGSPEALDNIKKDFSKKGLSLKAAPAKLELRENKLKFGDGRFAEVLSTKPLKLAIRGVIWNFDASQSLDANYFSLLKIVNAKSFHVKNFAIFSSVAEAVESADVIYAMSGAGVTMGLIMLAGITLPVWGTIAVALAAGVTLSAIFSATADASPKYQCTSNGFILAGFSKDPITISRSPKGLPFVVKQMGAADPAEVRAKSQDVDFYDKILKICHDNPKAISTYNDALQEGGSEGGLIPPPATSH